MCLQRLSYGGGRLSSRAVALDMRCIAPGGSLLPEFLFLNRGLMRSECSSGRCPSPLVCQSRRLENLSVGVSQVGEHRKHRQRRCHGTRRGRGEFARANREIGEVVLGVRWQVSAFLPTSWRPRFALAVPSRRMPPGRNVFGTMRIALLPTLPVARSVTDMTLLADAGTSVRGSVDPHM